MINIKRFIENNSDLRYADFNKKFITTKYPIRGVRIPLLRKFAKEIEPEYIEFDNSLTHEEILLYGFAASCTKTEEEQLEYLQNILPYIDNWGTCDSIVAAMKKLTKQSSYKYFLKLIQSPQEFEVRGGIVGLMQFFLKSEKIEEVMNNLLQIKNEKYYVKMAIAWFFAELFSHNYNLAKMYLLKVDDKFIRNRAISKARDSYRIDKDKKEELLKFRI